MSMLVPTCSFEVALAEHYAGCRMRLRAPEYFEPVPQLTFVPSEPHVVADPVPNQRCCEIIPIGAEAEIVATRRALMIFARFRDEKPADNSVRQLQIAFAMAFKVDLAPMLGRSRRPGPTRIRQIAMTMAMRTCKLARNQIAMRFDRNHATVHHAEKKLAAFLDGATSQIGGVDER